LQRIIAWAYSIKLTNNEQDEKIIFLDQIGPEYDFSKSKSNKNAYIFTKGWHVKELC
jgi:hypothetical protein